MLSNIVKVLHDIVVRHLDRFQDQELEGRRGFAIAALKECIRQDLEQVLQRGQQGDGVHSGPSTLDPDVSVQPKGK